MSAVEATPVSVAPAIRFASFRHIGPNWYAVVMGTAAVPAAGIDLPHQPGGSLHVWQVLWVLSAVELAVLLGARALHWRSHRDQARAQLLDVALAPYYACIAIAFLAVGLVTDLVGRSVIGEHAALVANIVLFSIGTAIGLVAAVGLVLLMILSHDLQLAGASPAWLLPVMGPMVSAAFAKPLLERMAPGDSRETFLLCCYALVGFVLIVTLLVFPMVVQRLFLHGALPVQLTPLLFLCLAPFGQSVNAVNNLADTVKSSGLAAPYADGFVALGLLYGVPVIGFALLWLTISLILVGRALRGGMRFSMAWWAFGFPLATVVTGMEGITRHTGIGALAWFTDGLFALLCVLVGASLAGTARGLATGRLFAAPAPARP